MLNIKDIQAAHEFDELKSYILTSTPDKQSVHDMLSNRFRLYHGTWHIAATYALHKSLKQWHDVMHDASDELAILHAIYYHDADNDELVSAQIWDRHASHSGHEAMTFQLADRVKRMIEATAKHDAARHADQVLDWFLDLDLAPLAYEPDLFDFSRKLIRLENHDLSDQAFNKITADLFHSLLHLPKIFHHPVMTEQFEQKARENMQRYLKLHHL